MQKKKQIKQNVDAELYSEYIHSSNSLFHFMDQPEFLKEILEKKIIYPRYCRENIEYMNLELGGYHFSEILVLQKCFCDIPLHNITRKARMSKRPEDGDGTITEDIYAHTDIYGEYGIAFSKSWAQQYNLQPLQYLNPDSPYCRDAGKAIKMAYEMEEIDDFLADSFMRRLAFAKPLKGWMRRKGYEIYKTFHDEREWRYVPDSEMCDEKGLAYLIPNPNLISNWKKVNQMNNYNLKKECYQNLWISYEYDEICYLIVPDNEARRDLIETILSIPGERFAPEENEQAIYMQKLTLISKILVLDQIRRDW